MNTKRLIQLVGLIMIGDGVTGLFKPRKHSLLWDVGPGPLREVMESMAENPGIARLVYAVELVFGGWLAVRETRRVTGSI